jgi:hypothetical protein
MSVRTVTGLGASLGAKFAFVYGLVFVVYGVTRYGVDLTAAPPDGSLWPIYAGGAVSLAVASLGITLIMAIAAAVLGAVTALCAAGLQRLLAKAEVDAYGCAISVAVAVAGLLFLHVVLWKAGLWSLSSLHSTTYLFWLGIPSLLYILAAVIAGRACDRSKVRQLSA